MAEPVAPAKPDSKPPKRLMISRSKVPDGRLNSSDKRVVINSEPFIYWYKEYPPQTNSPAINDKKNVLCTLAGKKSPNKIGNNIIHHQAG